MSLQAFYDWCEGVIRNEAATWQAFVLGLLLVTAMHWGHLFWNLIARLWWHARGRRRLFECERCAQQRERLGENRG